MFTVGYDDPFPPFAETVAGEPRGILIDRARVILERAAIAHRFVPLALAEGETLLARGAVDALAVKAIVPARADRLIYSAPVLATGAALFALEGSAIAAHHDVARVGAERIATPAAGPLTEIVRTLCLQASILPTASYAESLDAVIDGRADAAALNVHGGQAAAERRHPGRFSAPSRTFAALDFGIAFDRARADDRMHALIARIDRAIALTR